MENRKKFIAIVFLKGGQVAATVHVFWAFVNVLLYGQYVWVEPTIIILIGEIVWFFYSFIGSFVEAIQWGYIQKKKRREG